uniref:Ribosomal protein S18 n=1 Tax=Ombrophytum subterraneum TaxID=50155 RepID=A0A8E7MK00_9MAGN|nr:ribosomal protein S18 [Ombrophytum subterraneum]
MKVYNIFNININLIIKFTSEQGNIFFIKMDKLNFRLKNKKLKVKYKKLISIFIKKARIISIISFYFKF